MTKEYIEREALLCMVQPDDPGDEMAVITIATVKKLIRSLAHCCPAADVAEVRHGRWICINKRYGEYECSVCHGMDSNCSDYYGIHAVTEQEFCPSCGAKMDEEEVCKKNT